MDPGNEKQLTDQAVATPCAAASAPCLPGNDASPAQPEGSATQPTRLCAHCKRLARRKHQAYCLTCHGASMRVYRARQHKELAWLKWAAKELTAGWDGKRLTKAQSNRLRMYFNNPSRREACPRELGGSPTAGDGSEGNSHEIRNGGSTMKKEKHGI